MRGLGTDVMALACILGGAAVGGVVTVAALDRGGDGDAVCVSEVREAVVVDVRVDPRVRIRLGEARLRLDGELGEALELRLHEDLERVERELARLEGRAVR